ncbi:NAD(P)-dependent oxidoreductase [Helicobacter canis]|uniref:UDP-glucose 4-epimerase n=1 Tax=Helicobacter canis TaxID=29419 RepID=A0A377J4P9_9HELI|nr:NAD-dependent epimerase/dehydratase family protein [Helicobacter canis]STO96783.1 UDP-glucose 4-epimerase [Helicobacter canis]
MLTILLTGSTGFIGSHFIQACYERFHIIALVRPSSDTTAIAPYCKIAHYDGSIESLTQIFATHNIDGVVHLAAFVQSGRSKGQEITNLIAANLTLGTQILETLATYPARFFINTLSYFQFANASSYSPFNLYAATKQAFYDICVHYAATLPTKIVHILLYDTYGENDPRGKILSLWRDLLRNPPKQNLAMSDGLQVLDLTHIDDIISGFALAIDSIDCLHTSTIYTLESTNRLCLRELASVFESLANASLPLDFGARTSAIPAIQMPISVDRIDGELAANGGGGESSQEIRHFMPLAKLPNYAPKISLEAGLMRVISPPKK